LSGIAGLQQKFVDYSDSWKHLQKARGSIPRNALVNEGALLLGHKKLLSLRKASWVFCGDGAFVGLFVGLECAVLIVGEKFTLTRQRYQFSNYIGVFHAAIFTWFSVLGNTTV
jgi:hypothetical protein